MAELTAEDIIRILKLKPLEMEGGYFKQCVTGVRRKHTRKGELLWNHT